MSAPERIWVTGLDDQIGPREAYTHAGSWGARTPYILDTPEALAARPEVQALIAAAEFFAAVLCDYQKHMTDAPEVE